MARMKLPGTTMTEGEYRANLAGLNTFFGAVLGFVISGIEQLDAFRFGLVLALLGALVVLILYISASEHRIVYSLYALGAIIALPWIVDPILPPGITLPAKLQPTFIVWVLFTILVEFAPRTSPDELATQKP